MCSYRLTSRDAKAGNWSAAKVKGCCAVADKHKLLLQSNNHCRLLIHAASGFSAVILGSKLSTKKQTRVKKPHLRFSFFSFFCFLENQTGKVESLRTDTQESHNKRISNDLRMPPYLLRNTLIRSINGLRDITCRGSYEVSFFLHVLMEVSLRSAPR